MINIVIGNINSKIVGFVPDEINKRIDKKLSYKPDGVEYSKSVKEGKWDGIYHLYYKNKGQSFYTGLLSLVTDILKEEKVEFKVVDVREVPEKNLINLKFLPPKNYEEREYQRETVEKAIKRTRGILKMATGSGKTLCASKIISEIKTAPFMFYVLTKDLLEQAHDVFSSTLNEPIGRIGGGVCDIKNINVCTIQTAIRAFNFDNSRFKISDYLFDDEDKELWDQNQLENEEKLIYIKKLIANAKGIIMDETHHVASRTAKEIVTYSPCSFWRYGCSATPYREDNADILIQAMFGRYVTDINASFLIDKGFLVTPHIFFVPVNSKINLHSYKNIYSNCIVKNKELNDSVISTANFLLSKNLSSLILVQQYSHGDYLKQFIPNSIFVTSRMTGKERLESINKLRNREIMCMIASSLADEGLDIPNLDAVLLAGGGASATRVHQRIGRTLRIDRNSNKNKSIVVVYDHNAKFLHKHALKVKRIVKTEPSFKIYNSGGISFINSEIESVLSNSNGGILA